MTTPDRKITIPATIIKPLNLEIETAISLEKFKEQMQLDGKAEERFLFCLNLFEFSVNKVNGGAERI